MPELRVGIAFGTVTTRMGDVFGTTVNLASRLTSIAPKDAVLVDGAFAEELIRTGDAPASEAEAAEAAAAEKEGEEPAGVPLRAPADVAAARCAGWASSSPGCSPPLTRCQPASRPAPDGPSSPRCRPAWRLRLTARTVGSRGSTCERALTGGCRMSTVRAEVTGSASRCAGTETHVAELVLDRPGP